jgi:hypothetical protein
MVEVVNDGSESWSNNPLTFRDASVLSVYKPFSHSALSHRGCNLCQTCLHTRINGSRALDVINASSTRRCQQNGASEPGLTHHGQPAVQPACSKH